MHVADISFPLAGWQEAQGGDCRALSSLPEGWWEWPPLLAVLQPVSSAGRWCVMPSANGGVVLGVLTDQGWGKAPTPTGLRHTPCHRGCPRARGSWSLVCPACMVSPCPVPSRPVSRPHVSPECPGDPWPQGSPRIEDPDRPPPPCLLASFGAFWGPAQFCIFPPRPLEPELSWAPAALVLNEGVEAGRRVSGSRSCFLPRGLGTLGDLSVPPCGWAVQGTGSRVGQLCSRPAAEVSGDFG